MGVKAANAAFDGRSVAGMTDAGITNSADVTATQDDVTKIAELVKGTRIAVLTTRSSHGQLVSRPLAIQDRPFDGALWFFSPEPSPKTEDIAQHDQVNVAFESGRGWVSIAGTASISRDPAMIDELWNKYSEAWFPEGRDDPSVALIRVDADTVEYWSIDEPRVVTMFKVAKAIVTGTAPDVGESRTVSL